MANDLDVTKQNLRDEIDRLNYELKVELPKRIAEARAFGDLKENAEYDAARERQSFVKARMAQLSTQLSQLNQVNLSDIAENSVGYGSQVTVIDTNTSARTVFTFVSSGEVNPSEGRISLSSPIGNAMQGKSPGETVEITIPAGKRKYYIEKLVTIHGNVLEKAKE